MDMCSFIKGLYMDQVYLYSYLEIYLQDAKKLTQHPLNNPLSIGKIK